jgi:hypothetical protein
MSVVLKAPADSELREGHQDLKEEVFTASGVSAIDLPARQADERDVAKIGHFAESRQATSN